MSNKAEQEIDVIQLIEYFKNGVKKIIQLFLRLLKAIYHQFILILLFFKNNFLIIALPVIVAFIVGLVLDMYSLPIYKYDAIIKPSYGAENQISEFREDLQSAVLLRDVEAVSKKMNVSTSFAQNIQAVKIEPYGTPIDKVMMYNEAMKDLDSISKNILSYGEFIKNSNLLSKGIVFRILSLDNVLDLKMDTILKTIKANKSLNNKRKSTLEGLNKKKEIIENSLVEVNKLRIFNKEKILLELSKQAPNTNINIADSKETDNLDIQLFEASNKLSNDLLETVLEIGKSNEVVEVLSDFNTSGAVFKKDSIDKKHILLPLITSLIIISFILLMKLNKYLSRYLKNNKVKQRKQNLL